MEDLIDFPVSADWLDYYHSRGLTPRHSGRLQNDHIYAEITTLRKEMSEIRLLLHLLLEEIRSKRHSTTKISREELIPPQTGSLLKEGDNNG